MSLSRSCDPTVIFSQSFFWTRWTLALPSSERTSKVCEKEEETAMASSTGRSGKKPVL
jgi:hypothetical protein